MKKPAFTAVKLQTADIHGCETFFRTVFGFQVTHRYGGEAGDTLEEIVMTLRGEAGMMLKFVRYKDQHAPATGATIQITLDDIAEVLAAAEAANATLLMEPTDYPEAGVRMAVITTQERLDIELVQKL